MPLTFPPSGGNGHKSHTIYPLLVIPLLAIVLIAGTLAFYLNNQAHAAKSDTLVPLPDSVPAVAAKSKLLGPTDPHQTISLSFGLRLRNAAALDSYIADMNRPKSLNYHRHLTVNQIIGAFSPSQASHDAVLQYLQISGFTITHTYKHRMGIVFRGTIRQAEQIFHVSINNYTAPHGESFYSNATNPLLPSSLVGYVQSITGLNNVTRYHHAPIHLHSTQGTASKVKRTDAQTAPTNAGVSCPSSNSYAFFPNQIASAYDISGMHNFGFHGEGQLLLIPMVMEGQQRLS